MNILKGHKNLKNSSPFFELTKVHLFSQVSGDLQLVSLQWRVLLKWKPDHAPPRTMRRYWVAKIVAPEFNDSSTRSL